MSVFGTLKTIVTILMAIALFGEHAGTMQWIGLFMALAGILFYSSLKKKKGTAVDSVAFLGYDELLFEEEELDDANEPGEWDDWGAGISSWVGELLELGPEAIVANAESAAQ